MMESDAKTSTDKELAESPKRVIESVDLFDWSTLLSENLMLQMRSHHFSVRHTTLANEINLHGNTYSAIQG